MSFKCSYNSELSENSEKVLFQGCFFCYNHRLIFYFIYISTTYENIDVGYLIAPAIEYSLLPYQEALRKEITIAYTIGYLHRRYMEETIYGKISESLVNQALELGVRIRQAWGSVTAELEGSHFLHDPGKNRTSFESDVSTRF